MKVCLKGDIEKIKALFHKAHFLLDWVHPHSDGARMCNFRQLLVSPQKQNLSQVRDSTLKQPASKTSQPPQTTLNSQ